LFHPNIDQKGRKIRAIGGGICFLVSLILFFALSPKSLAITVILWILVISSLLMFFEAATGWCLLRACGIKTRI
jgi:hypothetical protein